MYEQQSVNELAGSFPKALFIYLFLLYKLCFILKNAFQLQVLTAFLCELEGE